MWGRRDRDKLHSQIQTTIDRQASRHTEADRMIELTNNKDEIRI